MEEGDLFREKRKGRGELIFYTHNLYFSACCLFFWYTVDGQTEKKNGRSEKRLGFSYFLVFFLRGGCNGVTRNNTCLHIFLLYNTVL